MFGPSKPVPLLRQVTVRSGVDVSELGSRVGLVSAALPSYRTDVGFADVVIDLRSRHRHPLPSSLMRGRTRRVIDDADKVWYVSAHASVRNPERNSQKSDVVLIVAPDGWRGAVVLPHFGSSGFDYGALWALMPFIGMLLEPSLERRNADLPTLVGHLGRCLGVLRAEMSDANVWEDIPAISPVALSLPWNEMVLRWASAGVPSDRVDLVKAYQMHTHGNYARGTSVLAWYAEGFERPEVIFGWLKAGVVDARTAALLDDEGITLRALAPLEEDFPGAQWIKTDPEALRGLLDAGWTSRALRAVGAQMRRKTLKSTMLVDQVVRWSEAVPDAQARERYLLAGFGAGEAQTDFEGPSPATPETLALMAALGEDVDDPSGAGWFVNMTRMGVVAHLYDLRTTALV